MSVIRKKPYVEKVVESLSDNGLELLRETLNTNKENVNCSLIGGNNLLKKFEKEYKGAEIETGTLTSLYVNLSVINTLDKALNYLNSLKSANENEFYVANGTNDTTDLDYRLISFGILTATQKPYIAYSITNYLVYASSKSDIDNVIIGMGGTPSQFDYEWVKEGWYLMALSASNPPTAVIEYQDKDTVELVSLDNAHNIYEIEGVDYASLTNLFSLNQNFKVANTELQGHIPVVGETIEKVYFNPNAYSTDSEWMLWYESLKQYKEDEEDLIGARLLKWTWANGSTSDYDMVINGYALEGVGTLTDILAFPIVENALLYVTNDALTGTYAQVYQQLGITEAGWYKVTISGSTPTGVTKLTSVTELKPLAETTYTVVEAPAVYIEQSNYPLFAKVVSYNTPFVETPIQNNLKPAVASVGETLNKVYINLGYFDNDLNKMNDFINANKLTDLNIVGLLAYKDLNNANNNITFNLTDDTAIFVLAYKQYFEGDFEVADGFVYLSQNSASFLSIDQENVNKWAKVKGLFGADTPQVVEIIDSGVVELPLEGTITEIDDLSLISVNKPFAEISGWIYDEVTPVNLQLENNNLKTGILVWNDEYCSLFAYHRFQDMKEYELDPENSYFKVINEDLSINELRRIAFTPTQETTVEVTTKYSQAIELEMRVVPTGSEGYCGVLYQCILNLEEFLKGLSTAFSNLSGTTVEITSATQLNTLLGLLDSSTLIQVMVMIAGLGAQRTEAKSYFINYNPNDGDAEPNVMTLLSAGYLSDLIFIDKTKIIGTLSSAFTTILGDGFAFDEAIIRVDNVSID